MVGANAGGDGPGPLSPGYDTKFLPHKEATQVWAVTQAAIEMTIATGGQLNGFITDIQKAFENIPRQPIRELSLHLGINEEVVETWFHFLEKMERFFLVQGEVSSGVILRDGQTTPDYKYRELWTQVLEAINSCEKELRIQHIAAHRGLQQPQPRRG